jgi:ribosomal protein S18 acetylase RimI-like enzyme
VSVLLRTADDTDLLAVGDLHRRSRASAYAHILSPQALADGRTQPLGEWWQERWKWEQDTHRLTIAEENGKIAGFSYVGPSEEPDAAELYAIHVDPEHIGTGIGRKLMMHAECQLVEVGGVRGVLWVLEDNSRARRFYERGGWRPDGTTRVEKLSGEPVPQLRYAKTLVGGSA